MDRVQIILNNFETANNNHTRQNLLTELQETRDSLDIQTVDSAHLFGYLNIICTLLETVVTISTTGTRALQIHKINKRHILLK